MSPVRVCVMEDEGSSLDRAVGFALSVWIDRLSAGQSLEWEQFARTGQAIRNSLTRPASDGWDCVFVWDDDASDALHAIARTVDQASPTIAALSPLVRRLADDAAEPPETFRCVRLR